MAKFTITKGARTAGHKATLEAINAKLVSQGGDPVYKVTETDTTLEVEAVGGLIAEVKAEGEENADIQKAVVQQVAAKGGMLSYGGSAVITPSGKRYHSLPLCGKLGALSALVGKEASATKKASKANLDTLLSGM